ncbi:CrcB [Dietzia sp. UCD-THP]|uniref:fluoride efflux transporter FluC n=1 Tax=Dietzia sp. UCD-THP TaxID=1292020 RepID=UPI0003702538|nr:CrcB family protein [Dietzia sp. UCD-THP]EYT62040.1 CrcB [Dietzia sp. UCD-THP]
MSRPPHLHPGLIALVALGGAAGTLARWGMTTSIPHPHGWPVSTLAENLIGAFLLGLLLEALVRAGDETRPRRMIRLGLCTGALGGFTTFSTFALEVERLLTSGHVGQAIGYFSVSLLGGFLTCVLGVIVASRHHQWRMRRLPLDPDQGFVSDPTPPVGDRP